MQKLMVAFRNCHGIRELDAEFDFSKGNAVAIYAPNGTMKTSFARTMADFARGVATTDHMFPARESKRVISDEGGGELESDDVVVVLSYDEEFGPSESTSTLLVNADLRKEYEALQVDLVEARRVLVEAVRTQAQTKRDVSSTVSRVFTQSDDNFFTALVRIEYEVQQMEDAPYADLPHDLVFNDKVDAILRSASLKEALALYVTRLNELLEESTFFSRETFSFYNATNVAKSLGDNGFFAANHSLLLKGEDEAQSVSTHAELESIVADEKKRITDDEGLRKGLDAVEKALNRNEFTRRFFAYIAENDHLLPALENVDEFQQAVWKCYLKAQEPLFVNAVDCFKASESRRREIERQAAAESTQWEKVIEIFNDRFFVPFRLTAENKHKVALGQEKLLKLAFQFEDGADTAQVEREELLRVLSNGEKKALYILNVLFEMEVRRAAGRETLVVIDDLADSFDYKNKYAIVQYLKEMAEHADFKLVLLTHNFDFFRTLNSRHVVGYNRCFMAQRGEEKVVLMEADYINNPFANAFKRNFFENGMQRIAAVPFVRNIIEYTEGVEHEDYLKLTSLLHWKSDSSGISNDDLDRIFCKTFRGFDDQAWPDASQPVVDLLRDEASRALGAAEGVNFENKIVLSIAIRLAAEQYMVDQIADPEITSTIRANQTYQLFRTFRERGLGSASDRDLLDTVVLMTPENIHVNSFMYEPIIDLSDTALRELYREVIALSDG